jgi:hypothetical protein
MLVGWAGTISRALADGDPASDVLASQPLFLPTDGGYSPAQQIRLGGLLQSAQREGYPIRVAVITTPADLGSVGELWRMPGSYARFLGQELTLVYRGTLLVVMPNGLGVYRTGGSQVGQSRGSAPLGSAPAAGAPPSLTPDRPGTSLVVAAADAVEQLAAAAGHRLAPGPAKAPRSSGSALGSVDLGSWLALAAGAALITLTWAASLRARPPARLRRAG